MYSEYLAKVAMKKQGMGGNLNEQPSMEVDKNVDEQMFKEYEMEETKEEKAKSMKTGEKYIIRKLISFKINIPKIDDYIQKLNTLEIKNDSAKFGSFSVNTNASSGIENVFSNYGQPMSANNTQGVNSNQYFNQAQGNGMETHPYKTLQGFNDDSQIAYQSQNYLFQQQMSQNNPFVSLNQQLLNGMQNMNLNSPNVYWDGNSFVQNTNSLFQNSVNGNSQPNINNQCHQVNQNNQGFAPFNGNFNSQSMQQTNMDSYSYPSTNQNMYPNSYMDVGQAQPKEPFQEEEVKELPAEMRLPSHVKRTHFRSNSVTPVDTQSDKYIMKNSFLFDRLNPVNTKSGLKFTKNSSENNATPQLRSAGLESSNSLPAIRNLSDYYDSAVSESSCFDGNDSAYASSIDIELDANGQPWFDSNSINGDSNSINNGDDSSADIPAKSKMARIGVKKKSGFCVQDRKGSVSSEGSMEGDH